MTFVWLRLLNAAIEIVGAVLLVPSTVILVHYGGRFRYLFIASLWVTLTGLTWITTPRLTKALPINDATVVVTIISGTVLLCAGSILGWYLFMSHHDRLPARTAVAA